MRPHSHIRHLSSLAILACAGLLTAAEPAPQSIPSAPILTPAAPATPRVNGPGIFGVRPGAPFLYSIAATGQRPMTFAVDGLPAGLTLDAATGRITGSLATAGEHTVTLRAKNALGESTKKFRIVVGDRIALTPPMGWSSWNCWGDAVSQELVLSSARAMAEKGLRDHGWTYINIDDGWQAPRGGEFNAIQGNKKFPDMKALGDELHALGLKFGIYSSPWTGTYAGYVGGSSDNADGTYPWVVAGDVDEFYHLNKDPKAPDAKPTWVNWNFGKHSFAAADARQWAAWGVDYLKYDWCDHGTANARETYKTMGDALYAAGRPVVYSLCEWGNNKPWEWAKDIAHLWRTTGDITDCYYCQGEYDMGLKFILDLQVGLEKYAGPDHWNDPDMLEVGNPGLTLAESRSHFSLWCMLAAPLMAGNDLRTMQPEILEILINKEAIAIDQDKLGKQGYLYMDHPSKDIFVKELSDGNWAICYHNTGDKTVTLRINWKHFGMLKGEYTVHDVWKHKDIGTTSKNWDIEVPTHDVVLYKLTKK